MSAVGWPVWRTGYILNLAGIVMHSLEQVENMLFTRWSVTAVNNAKFAAKL